MLRKIISLIFYWSAVVMGAASSLTFAEGQGSKERASMLKFNATVGQIPRELDIRSISTASDWQILFHLVMPLLKLSDSAEYEGYLARSWSISKDFKEYSFRLAERRFSDGSLIEPKHVVDSIKSQIEKGETVHFDFRSIHQVSIEGVDSVKIVLKEPSKQFLAQAAQSEFGVLHRSEVHLKEKERNFKVTSGPYYVVEHTEKFIRLGRNKYFADWLQGAPEEVTFYGTLQSDVLQLLNQGNIDFLEAFVDPAPHRAASRIGFQKFQPRLTQTGWVGINPRSKSFGSIANRRFLQKLIQSSKMDFTELSPGVEVADQLFIPGSPGRFDNAELQAIRAEIGRAARPRSFPLRLRLAAVKNRPIAPKVIAALEVNGLEIEYVPFDGRDLAKVLKKGEFDIAFLNNDFSATQTLENLLVATSGELPLMQLPPHSKVPKLISKAQSTFEGNERHALAKEVSRTLYDEGVIYPIVYMNFIYYVNPQWDVSRWSILTGDTPLWRMKNKRH